MDKYLAKDEETVDDFDVLGWWNNLKCHVHSRMTCDILGVPKSIVAYESTFSIGECILDTYKSSLTPKLVHVFMHTKLAT